MIHIGRYLERIGYQGTLSPDLETLRGLQLAHLRSVPFENLSIHRKQAIILHESLLYKKIVEMHRGGFCYELNGIFARVLREIGFHVDLVAASVHDSDGGFGPEFDHMALLVHLEEDYLVDVGFGDTFQQPLRVHYEGEQAQGERSYRIVEVAGNFVLYEQGLREGKRQSWAQYRFKPQAQQLYAFDAMCEYHQTSPASHFAKGRVCSMATVGGRISLSDQRLIVATESGREETEIGSEAEFSAALEHYFGIAS